MPSVSSAASQERLRRRYRPARVRLLFIGEAPPVSGRFFYQGDSGLYRAIRDAFRETDPSICDADFLDRFQAWGCFLIDVCPGPVDHLDARSRRDACQSNVGTLGRRIRQLRPLVIVTLLRSIRGAVDQAALLADWDGERIEVPYPGRWSRHRTVFLKLLQPVLQSLV